MVAKIHKLFQAIFVMLSFNCRYGSADTPEKPRHNMDRDLIRSARGMHIVSDVAFLLGLSRPSDYAHPPSNAPSLDSSIAGWSFRDRDSSARIRRKRLLFGRSGNDHAVNFSERDNDIR
jgi:hypothetical protein